MKTLFRTSAATSILALSLISSPAFAQQQAEQDVADDDFHRTGEIVVTAPYFERLDLLAGTSALSGEELAQQSRGQIGDTLLSLPGVSATSFTPGSSRPVLRGFQGNRVAVLTDGIGNIDASNTSADHAVTIESLTTERIEVLRGPAVLLFGGQAVGGAVNAIDKRIRAQFPRKQPMSMRWQAMAALPMNGRLVRRLTFRLPIAWWSMPMAAIAKAMTCASRVTNCRPCCATRFSTLLMKKKQKANSTRQKSCVKPPRIADGFPTVRWKPGLQASAPPSSTMAAIWAFRSASMIQNMASPDAPALAIMKKRPQPVSKFQWLRLAKKRLPSACVNIAPTSAVKSKPEAASLKS